MTMNENVKRQWASLRQIGLSQNRTIHVRDVIQAIHVWSVLPRPWIISYCMYHIVNRMILITMPRIHELQATRELLSAWSFHCSMQESLVDHRPWIRDVRFVMNFWLNVWLQYLWISFIFFLFPIKPDSASTCILFLVF